MFLSRKNSNSIICFCIIVSVLATICISRVNADIFRIVLSQMCIAFRGPVTIFCYFCVAFLIYLLFSKKGKIVIGGKDAKKEYSDFSWLSCLFMAGCGIGIVFYLK